MRLISFEREGGGRAGVALGPNVLDLHRVAPHLPTDLHSLFAADEDILRMVSEVARAAPDRAWEDAAPLRLLCPIPRPGKFVCVGLNYADHVAEGGGAAAPFPGMFHRVDTSFVGPSDPIIRPRNSEQFDYEGELLVVIGRRARHVAPGDALECVGGYSIFNDGSVRDFQKDKALAAGKNFDRSGAFGPVIVTADELPPGANGLALETRLNGVVVQQTNTSLMLFSVAEIISMLSEIHTLEPGDLISTGTCAGVGARRTPPLWMRPGDKVSVTIEKIGTLTNDVVAEP